MRSISLNIGNHLKALSMITASRDSSFLSCQVPACAFLWDCGFAYHAVSASAVLKLPVIFSILVFRFETLVCSFSLARSKVLQFLHPRKRESQPYQLWLSPPWWLSSLTCQCVFDFICFSSCSAKILSVSCAVYCIHKSSALSSPMIKVVPCSFHQWQLFDRLPISRMFDGRSAFASCQSTQLPFLKLCSSSRNDGGR